MGYLSRICYIRQITKKSINVIRFNLSNYVAYCDVNELRQHIKYIIMSFAQKKLYKRQIEQKDLAVKRERSYNGTNKCGNC